jgi:AsmA protein
MKKVLIGIGALLLILVLAVVSLPFLIDANQFRPRLESELSTALGREVKVGNLSLNILGGSVSADELTVADDRKFSSSPFLHARSLKLTVELWTLIFSRKLNILGLLIDQPEIALIQSSGGDWNFSGIGAKHPVGAAPSPAQSPAPSGSSSAPLALSAQLIRVADGRLAFSRLGGPLKPQALEGMNVEIHNFSSTAAFPFSMSAKLASGGDIHLDGKAGPMNSSDAAATPVEVTLKLNNLQLAGSGLVDRASGIDGVLSVDGTGTSNGRELNWNGRVHVEKLKLAQNGKPDARPVEFDFSLLHNVVTHTGTLSRGDMHVGGAVAHLTGSYAEQGESMAIKMHLAGSGMPVGELLSLLPPLDIRLPAGSSLQGGTAAVDATVAGPLATLVTDASMNVNKTTLVGFDMGSKLNFMEKLGGIKGSPNTVIDAMNANVHAAPEGQTIRELKLVIPALGNLDGSGTVSATHALDLRMRATVHTPAVIAALGQQRGDTAIPFFVRGTSENPSFEPDVKGIANEQVKKLETNPQVKNALGVLGGFLGGKK